MRWPSCRACVAKDAEISRLDALIQALLAQTSQQATEALKLARDAAGLTPPPEPTAAPDPVPQLTEDFLIVRFGAGTPEYRRQLREAKLLLAQGLEPLEVNERLKRGQAVDW